MDESIHTRQDLHESAEVSDPYNFASINIADDCAFTQRLNAFLGDLCTNAIGRSDVNSAILFDIDLGARLFLQRTDILTTRADQRADLIHRDLYCNDTRRVRLQFCAW